MARAWSAGKWATIAAIGVCCSRPSAPMTTSESPAPEPPPSAPIVASPAAAPAAPDGAAAVDAAAPRTLPRPALCSADADCQKGGACGEQAAECRCAAGGCARVRPEDARDADRVACQADADCAFDAEAGACVAGVSERADAKGIVCECDALNRRCVQIWRGEVTCKSFRDCSHRRVNGKSTVPVPAWFAPRRHAKPVRPCKDSEVDSVCEAGQCRIQAWKC